MKRYLALFIYCLIAIPSSVAVPAPMRASLLRTFVDENRKDPFYDRIAISRQGDFVAAGQGFGFGGEPQVTVWSVGSGKVVRHFALTEPSGDSDKSLISTFAFSPDAKSLAMVDNLQTISVRRLDSGKAMHTLRPGIGNIHGLKYSGDGKLLACLGFKNIAIYRLPEAAKPIVIKADSTLVIDADFSRDNRFLVSAGRERKVKLWRVADGRQLKAHGQHKAAIHACAFVEGTCGIASIDQNGIQFFWDHRTGKTTPAANNGPLLTTAAYSPDGRFSVRAGMHSVEVRSSQSGHLLASSVVPESILDLNASLAGSYAVLSGFDVVQVWSFKPVG